MKLRAYFYLLFILSCVLLEALGDLRSEVRVNPSNRVKRSKDGPEVGAANGSENKNSKSATGNEIRTVIDNMGLSSKSGKSDNLIDDNDYSDDADEDDLQMSTTIDLADYLENVNKIVRSKREALGRYIRDVSGGAGDVRRLMTESTQLANEVGKTFKLFAKREVTLTQDLAELRKALNEAVNALKKSLENENRELVSAIVEVDAQDSGSNNVTERKKRHIVSSNTNPYKACVSLEQSDNDNEHPFGGPSQPRRGTPIAKASVKEFIPPFKPINSNQGPPPQYAAPPNQEAPRTYVQPLPSEAEERTMYSGFGPIPMFPMPGSQPQAAPAPPYFALSPPIPQSQQYRQPAPPPQQYRLPAPPPQQYRPPAPPPQQYRLPTPPPEQYRPPAAPPPEQYRPPAPPHEQYRPPVPPPEQYRPPVPPPEQYRPPAPPPEQYRPFASLPPQQYGYSENQHGSGYHQMAHQSSHNRPSSSIQVNPLDTDVDLNEVYWLRLDPNRKQQKLHKKVDDLLIAKQSAGKDVLVIPISHNFRNVDQVKEGFLRAVRLRPSVLKSKREIFRKIRSLNVIEL